MSGGVSNGQYANETTFNDAFMARNADTDTVGKVGLLNNEPESGDHVSNPQGFINELADTDGVDGFQDANRKIYASVNYIANGDNRKVAIEKLDTQLKSTQDDLDAAEVRLDNLESADMTIDGNKTFSGETTFNDNTVINGNLTVNGTTTTVNTVDMDVTDRNITINKGGDDVSAEGAGITAERTGTFGSIAYENALESKWKVGDLGTESEILTADHNQEISGYKKFLDLEAGAILKFTVTTDAVSTGADAIVPTPTPIIKLTNALLESVSELASLFDGKMVIVTNATGDKIILKNNVGTNKIITGTGNDLFVDADASVWLTADAATNSWLVVGGTGGGGLFFQEVPAGSANGSNPSFGPLTYQPVNDSAVLVMVDGLIVPKTGYTIISGVITFGSGHIPATGQSVYVYYAHSGISVLPTFAGIQNVEYRTILPAEATAKQITLAGTPATSNSVMLDIIGGGPAFYGDDFTVTGNVLSWSGTDLDGIISAGDRFRIVYLT